MNSFKQIFSKYNTNKTIDYDNIYDISFNQYRQDIRLLFEIGVHKGGSIRGFKEYFPNALIIGFDISNSSFFQEERVQIIIGNATDPNVINDAIKKFGCPDISLDDGSHMSADIKATFNLLFPHTNLCYIIEDLGTQYKACDNGYYINDNQPATILCHKWVDDLIGSSQCACKRIVFGYSCCLMFKKW